MKDVQFLGSSKKNLLNFPKNAKSTAGYEIDKVQNGKEPSDWKPVVGVGKGVNEIRIHEDGEYRVIYVAIMPEYVYVLHAFHKKTQKVSKKDFERIRDAYKEIGS